MYQSPALGDGRGANKPWLQEMPDPVTKTVWQTLVEIHPETAAALDVTNGDHIKVETDQGTLEAPVFVYMGVRTDAVAIATGRGHSAYGRYANGVGLDPLSLLASVEDRAGGFVLTSTKARVTKTGEYAPLTDDRRVCTPARPRDRACSECRGARACRRRRRTRRSLETPRTTSCRDLRAPVANDEQGAYGNPESNDMGMYDPNNYTGIAKRRWAMSIDLARCTGCSACMTACYAENNIPTVGAAWQGAKYAGPEPLPSAHGWGGNILRNREMTWIRLERYFEGAEHPDGRFDPDFETRFVPMLCQHCGNAPCEPVCPVYATYHSPDGLNVQVYNRCVGHPVLLEQLPVQGALLQLVRVGRGRPSAVRVPRAAQLAAQSRRHGAWEGGDGEVHLLSAAHPGSRAPCARSSSASWSRMNSRRRARKRVRRARSPLVMRPTRLVGDASSSTIAAAITCSKSSTPTRPWST